MPTPASARAAQRLGARHIRFSTLCALAHAFELTPAQPVDALSPDPLHH